MWMFTTTLRRNVGHGSFQNIKQRLLYSLDRHIARERGVFIFPVNLVDLIDVDDSLLGTFHIAVGSLQQFENDVLNIFTHVSCFCKRSGIDDGERHAKHARQSLSQQCLSSTGGTDKQDVGLLNLHVGATATKFNSFVVLVDGHGKTLLVFILPTYILIEKPFD